LSPQPELQHTTAAIDDQPLRRQVIALAWPAAAEMLLFTMAQIADMIMVGRLGPEALAAVAVSMQPMFFSMAIFQAFGVGATAVVARAVGAGDPKEAGRAAGNAIALTFGLALLVGTLGVLCSRWVVVGMGAEPGVVPGARNYFGLLVGALPAAAGVQVTAAVLRGSGDTRTPMLVNGLSNILNIFLNYALIFGKFGCPALGVTGAGLATSLARVAAFSALVMLLANPSQRVQFRIWHMRRLDFTILRRVWRVGLPAAAEQFVMRGGQLCFVRTVASLGTTVLAAHQIAVSVESLAFMPAFGFGMASTALVGQNLGAGLPRRARQAGFETCRVGIIIMTILGLALFLGAHQVVRLYTPDGTTQEMSARVIRLMACVQPAVAVAFIMSGGLRGAGDTRWPLYATGTGIWLVRVGVGYLLGIGLGLGLLGAWTGMALDMVSRATVSTVRFYRGGWQKIRV